MTQFLPTIQKAVQLHQAGRLDEALALYRQVLAHEPRNAGVMHLAGLIAHQRGRHAEAVEALRSACAIDPRPAEFHVNLAAALNSLGRHQEAAEAARRALERDPRLAVACNNLAVAYTGLGRCDEAIAAANQALDLQPNYANAILALAAAQDAQGRTAAAIQTLSSAVDRPPPHPDVMVNLAEMLLRTGQSVRAAELCRRALALRPDHGEALVNLGHALYELADPAGGFEAHCRAVELQPSDPRTRSNFLMGLNYHPELAPETIAQEHHAYGRQCVPQSPAPPAAISNAGPNAVSLLRIGYVSPDFRRHSVASFLEPILAHHDRTLFHVTGYCNNRHDDEVTPKLAALCDQFRTITFLNDEQAAEVIRRDRIDILIDLAGHTQGNRLPLFARTPAPLQISYLGYPNITGLPAIDYRLTDAIADPSAGLDSADLHQSERLARLPAPFLCYHPPAEAPIPNSLPADTAGHITFGSFNNSPKLNPALIALWARVLCAVPDSHLVLKTRALAQGEFQAALTRSFAAHHIPHRLRFLGHLHSLADHLGSYHEIDIALDTHPYHGTTTTCEALHMGVPVVTLAGGVHAARVGVSLLHAIGLSDCVTATPDAYVARAASLAGDRPALRELRRTLCPRLLASPLADARSFTRNLEALYRELWTHHTASAGTISKSSRS